MFSESRATWEHGEKRGICPLKQALAALSDLFLTRSVKEPTLMFLLDEFEMLEASGSVEGAYFWIGLSGITSGSPTVTDPSVRSFLVAASVSVVSDGVFFSFSGRTCEILCGGSELGPFS